MAHHSQDDWKVISECEGQFEGFSSTETIDYIEHVCQSIFINNLRGYNILTHINDCLLFNLKKSSHSLDLHIVDIRTYSLLHYIVKTEIPKVVMI